MKDIPNDRESGRRFEIELQSDGLIRDTKPLEPFSEDALLRQPERYVVTRDKNGGIIEVIDRDNGRLWQKARNGWIWID